MLRTRFDNELKHSSRMTVRGGKNRVLVYTGAGLLLVALVLFYHNAATRLDDAKTKYEKCHLNEESLSAQLQVILEHKMRLEKSLQQEKSDHAQTKEEMKNKAEEDRQTRERENLESINKFTALQQQYKLLQSQHEDVTQELDKTKQQMLTGEVERSHLEEQIASLTQEKKHLQQGKESDVSLLQDKLTKLEAEYETLKKSSNSSILKEKADLQRELTECLKNHSTRESKKTGERASLDETIDAPALAKRSPPLRSSTAARRADIVPGGVVLFNTSTPMINPDAVQSQDRTAPGGQLANLPNIPVVKEYRQQLANPVQKEERPHPQAPPPANEMPRNQGFNNAYDFYKEVDNRKEEEDDDFDQMDEKELGGPEPAHPPAEPVVVAQPRDSVMLMPK